MRNICNEWAWPATLTAGAVGITVAAAGALFGQPAATPAVPAYLASAETWLEIVGPVLLVSDLERSLRFYTDGLGLTVFRRLPPGPGPGAVLVAEGRAPPPHILIRQAAAAPGKAGSVELGKGLSRIMLAVADSSTVAESLRAAGYQPTPLNQAKIFFVTDPDGCRYEVIQVDRAK